MFYIQISRKTVFFTGILKNYNDNTLIGMEHTNLVSTKELPICNVNDWDNIEIMNQAFEKNLKKKIAIASLDWV
ncbi:9158_t:CDS:2 [Diversispora eburnea]|uniref:9158_t:CDS:1 n=1 Tax=Diversispora eburnea TaxID=1213867 RepID=A0A9N8VBQ6_9GLOM|nr:9158_t:CDS:2 [Diversispora eburnea]